MIPAYEFLFRYSRGLPHGSFGDYLHFNNATSQNWLWFLPVLFLFDVSYLALTRLGVRFGSIPLAGYLPVAGVVAFAGSFLVGGVAGFRSWTHTPILDFENERLLMYFLTFLLGVICAERRTLADRPTGKVLYNVANGLAWLPVTAHVFVRLIPFLTADFAVTPTYRLLWWSSFYLSLVAMVYVVVQTFRRYADRAGPLWSALNANSYGVYVIHVVVLGAIGTLLLGVPLPGWGKYLLLLVLAYTVSNLAVGLYRGAVWRLRPLSVRRA